MDENPSPLNLGEFVVFEFKPVTNIDAEGEQCNRNLGNYTGLIIFDISIIAADINNSTQHMFLLLKTLPWNPRGG